MGLAGADDDHGGEIMTREVRKITSRITDEQLQADLERYGHLALEFGATDTRPVTSDMILIDERVRAKCLWPKCGGYGLSAHCPPHAPPLDEVRTIVSRYRRGLFVRLGVATDEIAGKEAREKKLWWPSSRKLHEIVSKLESEAFFNGYHLALGFGSGSCKGFCADLDCTAIQLGQACRFPLKARPSMESVGMDVFTMATRVGWEVYPIGASISPGEVPIGSKFGLVLID
jgi:predicted metal-binding protein